MKTPILSAALAASCLIVVADELKPLKYEAVTNYVRYERYTTPILDPNNTNLAIGWHTETTNWPAAIIHSVTWGRGTNAVFVLKTCEVMERPSKDWSNVDWKYYQSATWVERVNTTTEPRPLQTMEGTKH